MLVAIPAAAGQPSAALETVDKYLVECYERLQNATPGFAVVLVDHDRVVFLKAFGIESIFGRRPFTVDSVCPVGSLTKSFTALAVVQLAEPRRAGSRRSGYQIPPLVPDQRSRRSDRITVRMLLNHTSGLPSRDEGIFEEGSVEDAMEQAIRTFRARKTSRQPGQAFEYANEGYTVAGLIIHHVTGKSYCDYLQSALLDPLKMERSAADEEGLESLNALTGHSPGIDRAIPARFSYVAAGAPSGATLACKRTRLGPVPDRDGQSWQGWRRASHRTECSERNDGSHDRFPLSGQLRRRWRSQHLALRLGMDDREYRRTSPGASRGGYRAGGIDRHDRSRSVLGRRASSGTVRTSIPTIIRH